MLEVRHGYSFPRDHHLAQEEDGSLGASLVYDGKDHIIPICLG